MNRLTVNDMFNILGIQENDIPERCKQIISEKNFIYEILSRVERDAVLFELIRSIDGATFTPSGKGCMGKWENGWGEILDNFIKSGYKKQALIPQYNLQESPIRLYGDYIKPGHLYFENDFIDIIRSFVYYTYFSSVPAIYEFGCGTGYHLTEFAEMNVHQKYQEYHGLDWVPQSKSIVDLMNKKLSINTHGHVFDMFEPDYNLDVIEGSGLFTCGSLEQLGKDFKKFVDFMLSKSFSVYVHLNSILELYDIDNSLADYLIYRFEVNRNYLNGYFSYLKELESQNKIKILTMRNIPFGGIFGDGYSLTAWIKQ